MYGRRGAATATETAPPLRRLPAPAGRTTGGEVRSDPDGAGYAVTRGRHQWPARR